MESGIYKITCNKNNKIYIGSAVNIFNRLYNHIWQLNNKQHHSLHLQNAWNKYGEYSFDFDIIENCEPDQLLIREQHYLDTLLFAQEYIRKENNKFKKLGFNINPTAGNSLGREFSEETKKRISESGKAFFANNPDKRRLGNKHPLYGKPSWNKGRTDLTVEQKRKKIVRLNLNGELIETFSYGKEIESNGLARTIIRKCCNGKQPIYKESIWMYEVDYLNEELRKEFIQKSLDGIEKFKQNPRLKKVEILKKDAEGNLIEIINPINLESKHRRTLHLVCGFMLGDGGSNYYKGYYYSYGNPLDK